jgi:hypothetical protein
MYITNSNETRVVRFDPVHDLEKCNFLACLSELKEKFLDLVFRYRVIITGVVITQDVDITPGVL